ncbi:MAG: hypothetical protein ABEK59_08505 [Halobacteria archaeon]
MNQEGGELEGEKLEEEKLEEENPEGVNRRRWLAYVGVAATGVSGCLGAQQQDSDNVEDNRTEDDGGEKKKIPETAQASCDKHKKLDTDISKDTVLGIDCNEFRVTGEIKVVDGAELRILPGATVEFDEGATIKFLDGHLRAQGRKEKPITFTGTGKQRGFWKGLYFSNPDSRNVINHSVIEYGGSKELGDAYEASNLIAELDTELEVKNTIIQESDGYGFYIGSKADVKDFSNNKVSQNSLGAGYVQAPSLHGLSATTTYTGNGNDVVDVEIGGTPGLGGVPAGEEVSWPAISADYRFKKGRVDGIAPIRGDLTIEPGATLRFERDTGLAVKTDGSLKAVGETPEGRIDPITFSAVKSNKGYWRGIYLQSSKSEKNQLRNVVIEYGGSESYNYADKPANLTLARGSTVDVTDSTLRESGGYGFFFDPRSELGKFTGNTVTANREGAGRVNAPVVHQLSGDSTFRGNDRDFVEVVIGQDTKFTGIPSGNSVTWSSLDVPYLMVSGDEGDVGSVRGDLKIEKGSKLVFSRDTGLSVKKTGSLKAIGGSGSTKNSIVFTGESEERGYWLGLNFEGSRSDDNVLKNAVVEYGGGKFSGEDRFWYIGKPANVVATRSGKLTVENCKILKSGGFGVAHNPDFDITLNGNRFAGNRLGTVYEGT